jgi:hypothetical protein
VLHTVLQETKFRIWYMERDCWSRNGSWMRIRLVCHMLSVLAMLYLVVCAVRGQFVVGTVRTLTRR